MLELADIFRAAGPAYARAHAGQLLPSHRRAMAEIVACRTPALGGSLYQCDACAALDYRYHSCRNRHCPKCQDDRAQQWLARVQTRLLPCDHYLLTFTLPSALRTVARSHQRLVYGALLQEAARAVQTLAADRQWVGGTPGILAVLHTWSRTVEYHPHAHLLVTAGGLAADGATWMKPAHPRFFLPGYALSAIFRAKLRDAVRRMGLYPDIDPRVWTRAWTVHVQQIGTGEHAARYLSRYIYRVALTNQCLERFADGRVTFRYTHARTHETRRATVPVDTFIGRFLQHVLPRGFTKIRSYGLLSPSRRLDLARTRSVLDVHARASPRPHGRPTPAQAPTSPGTVAAAELGDRDPPAIVAIPVTSAPATRAVSRCPACHRGYLRCVERYHPSRAPPS